MALLSAQPYQYAGRSVDILMFDDFRERGDTLVTQALVLPGQRGAVIAGIEKLAQRFVIELLTEQGSVLGDPTRGCPFMTDANRNRWNSQQDVNSSFNLSLVLIQSRMVQDQLPTDPPDERLRSATLTEIIFTRDRVAITIEIQSVAGTDRVVLLPLRTTLR